MSTLHVRYLMKTKLTCSSGWPSSEPLESCSLVDDMQCFRRSRGKVLGTGGHRPGTGAAKVKGQSMPRAENVL